MADVSDQGTGVCSHCDRAIPSSNIDLHNAHCSRNLEKCKLCGEMVPKKYAEEHYSSVHAPVSCLLCSETMEPETLDIHTGEKCPRRIVTCQYCEFPLPAIDLFEHQDVCGNRTELCHLCSRYIRLRERDDHVLRCNGVSSSLVDTSRGATGPERERDAGRRQRNKFSARRLAVTVAIAGIALLFGSFVYQRKAENSQLQ